MNGSDVVGSGERNRVLNAVPLKNAVLCAECDVVSDSPHDHCLVCGSRSLFNISRLLGGMLPSQRAKLVDPASRPFSLPKVVLRFPKTPGIVVGTGESGNGTGTSDRKTCWETSSAQV